MIGRRVQEEARNPAAFLHHKGEAKRLDVAGARRPGGQDGKPLRGALRRGCGGCPADEGEVHCPTGAARPGYTKPPRLHQATPATPSRPAYAQLKLKLMLIRSASTRLEATSWRSQLSNKITEPAFAG